MHSSACRVHSVHSDVMRCARAAAATTSHKSREGRQQVSDMRRCAHEYEQHHPHGDAFESSGWQSPCAAAPQADARVKSAGGEEGGHGRRRGLGHVCCTQGVLLIV